MGDLILAILSVFLILLGIIGSILPVLPATPLSYVGLVIYYFTSYGNFSWVWLVVFGILTLASIILGYYIPIYGTKKFGGSNYGNYGAILGLIVGALFFSPFGIILGPIIGAFAGELFKNKNNVKGAFRAASGSFVGFLLSTGINIFISCAMLLLVILKSNWK